VVWAGVWCSAPTISEQGRNMTDKQTEAFLELLASIEHSLRVISHAVKVMQEEIEDDG